MIWIWLLRIPLLGDNAYLSALADVDAVTEERKFTTTTKSCSKQQFANFLSGLTLYKKGLRSVTNSLYERKFAKTQAGYERIFCKNTSVIRVK